MFSTILIAKFKYGIIFLIPVQGRDLSLIDGLRHHHHHLDHPYRFLLEKVFRKVLMMTGPRKVTSPLKVITRSTSLIDMFDYEKDVWLTMESSILFYYANEINQITLYNIKSINFILKSIILDLVLLNGTDSIYFFFYFFHVNWMETKIFYSSN